MALRVSFLNTNLSDLSLHSNAITPIVPTPLSTRYSYLTYNTQSCRNTARNHSTPVSINRLEIIMHYTTNAPSYEQSENGRQTPCDIIVYLHVNGTRLWFVGGSWQQCETWQLVFFVECTRLAKATSRWTVNTFMPTRADRAVQPRSFIHTRALFNVSRFDSAGHAVTNTRFA